MLISIRAEKFRQEFTRGASRSRIFHSSVTNRRTRLGTKLSRARFIFDAVRAARIAEESRRISSRGSARGGARGRGPINPRRARELRARARARAVLNATHVTRPKLTLTSVSVREAARASAATIDLYYFEKASGMNASIIAELSSELASSTTWRDSWDSSWEALALPPSSQRVQREDRETDSSCDVGAESRETGNHHCGV